MLDENLPTFHFRLSPETPLSTILYFTQNGSEPAAEYVLRRPDPVDPLARRKYASALCDPFNPAVVYGEVLVEPQWTQPTLSTAELRANPNGAAAPATPVLPDAFKVLLYNPDQSVGVRMSAGGWNKNDSWEFEMPTQTFKMPSSSELDRRNEPAAVDHASLVPRIVFRWKKDGKLSKDMTCYMSGKTVGGKKSKEPDITVALFKAGGNRGDGSSVQIYEPNLARVEVEDRKGLEVVMLLVAEVVKDLWLLPKNDVFNVSGAPVAAVANGGKRKNSKPVPVPAAATAAVAMAGPGSGPTMAGAISSSPPRQSYSRPTVSTHAIASTTPAAAMSPSIDAETRRLKAMVEQEEREQRAREARERAEREKRDKAEEKRIKKMLDAEEKERQRREADIARETERLRKLYGTHGQHLSASGSGPGGGGPSPALPPRQSAHPPLHPHLMPGNMPLPRPVSAGPSPGLFNQPPLNSWWHGPAGPPVPPPQQQQYQSGRRRDGSGSGLGLQNPLAGASSFFGRGQADDERKPVQKKRSVHW